MDPIEEVLAIDSIDHLNAIINNARFVKTQLQSHGKPSVYLLQTMAKLSEKLYKQYDPEYNQFVEENNARY